MKRKPSNRGANFSILKDERCWSLQKKSSCKIQFKIHNISDPIIQTIQTQKLESIIEFEAISQYRKSATDSSREVERSCRETHKFNNLIEDHGWDLPWWRRGAWEDDWRNWKKMKVLQQKPRKRAKDEICSCSCSCSWFRSDEKIRKRSKRCNRSRRESTGEKEMLFFALVSNKREREGWVFIGLVC